MLLKSSQIALRAVEPEDLELLYKWENSTDLWVHGNTLAPYSKLALRQYINDALEMDVFQSRQLRLMIDLIHEGVTIGTVDLYDIDAHHRKSGIGILIDDAYRKKGFAYQALELMADYAFGFLNMHQIYAYIAVDNKNSIKLFNRAGYKEIGVLKDWLQSGDLFKDVQLSQLINIESNE